mmetsp:Transcript_22046/g.50366  ORF Transcript_22046/g.50366 Transcript_22046/m.50366 type:complete len:607 (-) Transcript_22046:78-1898(-)
MAPSSECRASPTSEERTRLLDTSSDNAASVSRGELCEEGRAGDANPVEARRNHMVATIGSTLQMAFVDILVWIAFAYVMIFLPIPAVDAEEGADLRDGVFPDGCYHGLLGLSLNLFLLFLALLFLCMLLWRLYRAHHLHVITQSGCQLPYTSGYAVKDGKELILVATLHISPRACQDAEMVIGGSKPDLVMIELDEERLERLKGAPATESPMPRQEDLQRLAIHRAGHEPLECYAQRAMWNGEQSGRLFHNEVTFDESNAYGMQRGASDRFAGKVALVKRGSANGEFAPYALKAHHLARAGAEALLIMNNQDHLPARRIGTGGLWNELQISVRACSCGFPPIPTLLLPKNVSDDLQMAIVDNHESIQAEFQVMPDNFPRRTLRARLCQDCGLFLSGIGVLYGVIQCFGIEVGGEFVAAEAAASSRNIDCKCIDVNMNQFWSRLCWALLPTPCNIGYSLLSWLAFPRVLCCSLFPSTSRVDVMGTFALHCCSLRLRTWIGFTAGVMVANFVTTHVLKLMATGTEQAAEATGQVSEEDRSVVTPLIMLAIELYVITCFYGSILASRDEAMYNGVIAECRRSRASRAVVVLGAAHSNGVLQHLSSRGFW